MVVGQVLHVVRSVDHHYVDGEHEERGVHQLGGRSSYGHHQSDPVATSLTHLPQHLYRGGGNLFRAKESSKEICEKTESRAGGILILESIPTPRPDNQSYFGLFIYLNEHKHRRFPIK